MNNALLILEPQDNYSYLIPQAYELNMNFSIVPSLNCLTNHWKTFACLSVVKVINKRWLF